mmetsp:Transcript_3281/g.5528  ORF Transcript_3281/g.5528 Transcript_3281/m.5528 type:complete len:285 (-) Transcript_3281:4159-5013(-)
MHLDQAQHTTTNFTAAANANFAHHAMLQQIFHLLARCLLAKRIGTSRRVHKSFEEQRQRVLSCTAHLCHPLHPLGLGSLSVHTTRHDERCEGMLVSHCTATVDTNIIIATVANVAVVPLALKNVCVTLTASIQMRRCIRIVQVIQHHHGRVLGTAQLVKLVAICGAQRKKGMARLEQLVLEDCIVVWRVNWQVLIHVMQDMIRRVLGLDAGALNTLFPPLGEILFAQSRLLFSFLLLRGLLGLGFALKIDFLFRLSVDFSFNTCICRSVFFLHGSAARSWDGCG